MSDDLMLLDPANDVARCPVAPSSRDRLTKPHRHRSLPIRAGTRTSPLALAQTRAFLSTLTKFCPVLRGMEVFQEHAINTTGDTILNRPLAEIGGKGLFAKEIHEALADGRIDFAVHSLKDLETELPPGIALACVLKREDSRDVLILGDTCDEDAADPRDPFACLPEAALIGTCSVRRQAQLLHARPDLRMTQMRGNVQTRLGKLRDQTCDATLLALAGLRRLDLADEASVLIDPDVMVPAAGQGIVGVTVRADDSELRELMAAIEDPIARDVAMAERTMLAELDGTCRTPIGGHARILADGQLTLTGLIARADGSFLLKRTLAGAPDDAARIGRELGISLRADAPSDVLC